MEEKSITYRSVDDPREVHVQLLREGVNTMAKMMHFVAKLHKNKRCLGTRDILAEEDEIQPNKRVFKKVSSQKLQYCLKCVIKFTLYKLEFIWPQPSVYKNFCLCGSQIQNGNHT